MSEQTSQLPMNPTCPTCGASIASGALAGLCPACLLKSGAASDTVTQGGRTLFEPPPVAELAMLFPALEIVELIGKGGMGAVYKARQKQLDRWVALKILPPSIGEDAAFAERFAREARALAKLNHPGIVTLYEFGHVAQATGPLFYFLMEFVDGVNLKQLLDGGRISPREALAIVPQICDALQFAHDQGIVHRDIKPENLLIDRRGAVKVADFGLAKLIEPGAANLPPSPDKGAAQPHGPTGVMGTPRYMAPEQSERPSEVDHRADIYALGVVFYQMLTGELPAKELRPPSTKVQIDVRLDEIVLRALERNPSQRYSAVSEMKTQVETLVEMPPIHPKHAPPAFPAQGVEEPARQISRAASMALAIVWWFMAFLFVAFAADSIRRPNAWAFAAVFMAVLLPFLALLADRRVSAWTTDDRGRRGLRLFAWLGFAFAFLAIGLAIFFLNSSLSEQGGWHPAPPEMVVVPMAILGALLLPAAATVLWHASGTSRRVFWGRALACTAASAAIVVVVGGGIKSARVKEAQQAASEAEAAMRARLIADASPSAPAMPSLVPDFQIRRVLTDSDADVAAELLVEPRTQQTLKVERANLLDGSAISGAFWEESWDKMNPPNIRVKLTADGSRKFQDTTRAMVKQQLAVLINSKIISTPIIQTEMRGESIALPGPNTDEERDALLKSLNVGSSELSKLRFGRTNSVTIPNQIPNRTAFLSLESGRWETNPPPPLATRQFQEWRRLHNVDLAGSSVEHPSTKPSPAGVLTFGLALADVGKDAWERITPEMARLHWDLQDKLGKTMDAIGTSEKVGTFLFRTAKDVFGVVQVLGPTPDGSGVNIRYKLVEHGSQP